jgi:LCP family protein required for cell wall assembly
MTDSSDASQTAALVPLAATRRRPHRGLRVLVIVVALLTALVGSVVGWGYLKFRAIPKIHVSHSVLGNTPDPAASTIAYDIAAITPPATLPANADTAVADTTVAGATDTVPLGDVPVTEPATPVVDSSTTVKRPRVTVTTELTVSGAEQAALEAADVEDAAEVTIKKGAPTTKKHKVVFDTVPPGPIVDLRGVEAFGGPNTQNILMIGVDSRADVPKGQEIGFGVGQVGGSRTDTMIILRIDRDAHKAWILSIPRDLWVPIAGGQFGRINSAFQKSADVLVKTIQNRLAIPIDHVVQVNFSGFQKIVDTVGGVEICFPYPTRDPKSGLNHPDGGCAQMNGQASTAYVRSRHYQQFIDGVWKEDPRSDLGRIVRQQSFIRLVLGKVRDQATNPIKVNSMLDDLRSAIAIDSTISFPEATSFANDLRSFDPATLESFTVPTKGARIQGKAVLKLDTVKGKAILGKFRRA